MKRAWILLSLALPVWAQSGIDCRKTEILKCYRDLVQIDTRAGKETKAVEYLEPLLSG